MAKLPKEAAKGHLRALELCKKDHLTSDERWEVMENYREDAQHSTGLTGAFFTPLELAKSFSIETGQPKRLIDLCAGIGVLSYMKTSAYQCWSRETCPEIVCVELNADYIEIGKKIVPDATWIQTDVFDLPDLGHFDIAIGNPPFGRVQRNGKGPRYTGPDFEYHVMDIARDLADYGVFIIPRSSAPFELTDRFGYREQTPDRYSKFRDQTGIELEANCGIYTDFCRDQWHGASPSIEIVCTDFIEARARRPAKPTFAPMKEHQLSPCRPAIQGSLFDSAA